MTAEYVLEYRNTKLAVIEAKAADQPLTQAWDFRVVPPALWTSSHRLLETASLF